MPEGASSARRRKQSSRARRRGTGTPRECPPRVRDRDGAMSRGSRVGRAKSRAGLDVAEGRHEHLAQPGSAARAAPSTGAVSARSRLRHDERVRDRRLLQRLLAAQPVDGVDRRHDASRARSGAGRPARRGACTRPAPGRPDRSSRPRRGETAGSRHARAGSSRSRNSSARSPRSVQQTHPERSSTVRSSTRRSR